MLSFLLQLREVFSAFKHRAMRRHWKVGSIAPHGLTPAVGCEWSNLRSGRFTTRERAPSSQLLERRLGGPQKRRGRDHEENNLCSCRKPNTGRPASN
jgi:hypothetical protein